jgi:hypothetical protein
MISMLAIRSDKSITVVQSNETAQAAAAADKLERILDAYLDEHSRQKQRDPFRDSVYYAVMRGRAGLLTAYDPLRSGMRIRLQALDPLGYWPVASNEGVEWFTREYVMSRLEMQTFFDKVEREAGAKPIPETIRATNAEEEDMRDNLRVVEYWDEKYHAFSVEGQFYRFTHDYGFCPLVEFRFNETPEQEQRWAYAGLLSAVHEDLKLHATLLSKMATGAEQFYYPRLYYITRDGAMGMVSHHSSRPGDFVEIAEGTEPIILNPTANTEAVSSLLQMVETSIGESTLNPMVFTQDLPDVSGFLVSQFYSVIQDSLADKRDPMERAFGIALGQVLQLMEMYAHEQEDEVWKLAAPSVMGRRPAETRVSAADIGGNYRVRFRVKVSLPVDKVGMATQFGMMREAPPGMPPELAWEDAMMFSGIADEMGDLSGMKRRAEFEFLKMNDPEVQELWIGHTKWEHRKELEQMRKDGQKFANFVGGRKAKEVEKALDDPIDIPANLKSNPEFLHGLASFVEGGGNADDFITQTLASTPTADLFVTPEEADAFLAEEQQRFGTEPGSLLPEDVPGGQPEPEGPGPPFSGFEGVNPQASPPAAQGAMPRKGMDQARLQVDQARTLRRRGSRPPAK